jgi:hypothetical protein
MTRALPGAERALRCVPLGRKAWLFCCSDCGEQRTAIVYSLIQTCRLNDVDPQAWLADVLARISAMTTDVTPIFAFYVRIDFYRLRSAV